MRRHTTMAIGALIALLVLTGCTATGSVDGPVVEGDHRTGEREAEVKGELVLESECLYLLQPDSGVRHPVVWPYGTAWDPEQSAVVLPGGKLVHEGDWVSGGGGYHSNNLDRFTVPEGVELLLACVDNQFGEIAVFNATGAIDVHR